MASFYYYFYYYLLRFPIISDQEKEILIELLSEHPVFYLEANINYKDARTVKPNNWKEIALVMKEKLIFLTKAAVVKGVRLTSCLAPN